MGLISRQPCAIPYIISYPMQISYPICKYPTRHDATHVIPQSRRVEVVSPRPAQLELREALVL